MRPAHLCAVLTVPVLLVLPAPVGAQMRSELRGYIAGGSVLFAANRTFESIAGSNRAGTFGAGLQVAGLWKELLVDVSWWQCTVDGERVSIDDDAVVPLGIPLRVRMRPLDIAVGWGVRYRNVSTFVATGVSRLAYKETSESALPAELLMVTRQGPLLLGGAEIALGRWLRIGGEIRYRHIAGILGEGGTSAVFGERSAGGLASSLRVAIGR